MIVVMFNVKPSVKLSSCFTSIFFPSDQIYGAVPGECRVVLENVPWTWLCSGGPWRHQANLQIKYLALIPRVHAESLVGMNVIWCIQSGARCQFFNKSKNYCHLDSLGQGVFHFCPVRPCLCLGCCTLLPLTRPSSFVPPPILSASIAKCHIVSNLIKWSIPPWLTVSCAAAAVPSPPYFMLIPIHLRISSGTLPPAGNKAQASQVRFTYRQL